ncbi:hypothetical protein ILYODFUR_005324 [Ilyodon furcidens]|uniref:Uncharacterized protein n=1 Tax=Ilyodon furcidens TaxID=33524 RepID=A0ABV0SIM7_9TELE
MATLLGSEFSSSGRKRRNCNNNIVTKLTSSKITGKGFSRGTELPGGLLQERDKPAKWHGIPDLLQKLHESSHPNSDLSHAHVFLKVHSIALNSVAVELLPLVTRCHVLLSGTGLLETSCKCAFSFSFCFFFLLFF